MNPDTLDKILAQAVHKAGVSTQVYQQRAAEAEMEVRARRATIQEKESRAQGKKPTQAAATTKYTKILYNRSKLLASKEKLHQDQVAMCEELLQNGSLRQRLEEMFRISCSHGPDLETERLSLPHFTAALIGMGITTQTPYHVFQPYSTIQIKERLEKTEITSQVHLNRIPVDSIERIYQYSLPPQGDEVVGMDFPSYLVALQEVLRSMIPADSFPSMEDADIHRQMMCALCLDGFGKRYISDQRPVNFDEFRMTTTMATCVRDQTPVLVDAFLYCVDPVKFPTWRDDEREEMYVSITVAETNIELENFMHCMKFIDFRFAVTNSELVYNMFEKYDTKTFSDRVTIDFFSFQIILVQLAFVVFQSSGDFPTPQARFYQLVRHYIVPKFLPRPTIEGRRDEVMLTDVKPSRAYGGTEMWVFGKFQIRETKTGSKCPLYLRFGENGPVARGWAMSSSVATIICPRVPDTEDTVTTARLVRDFDGPKISVTLTTQCPVFGSSDRLQWTQNLDVLLTYEMEAASILIPPEFYHTLRDLFHVIVTRPPPSSTELSLLEQLNECPPESLHMFVQDWSKVCRTFPFAVVDDGDPLLFVTRYPRFFETATPHPDSKVNALLPSLDLDGFITLVFKHFISLYGASNHVLQQVMTALKGADQYVAQVKAQGALASNRKKPKVPYERPDQTHRTCVNCGQDPGIKTADTSFLDLALEKPAPKKKGQEEEDIGTKFLRAVGGFSSNLPQDASSNLTNEELQRLPEDKVGRLGLRGQFAYLCALMSKYEESVEEKRKAEELRFQSALDSVKSSGKFLTLQLLKLQQCTEGLSDSLYKILSIVQETEQCAFEERRMRLAGMVTGSETLWAMILQLFEGLKTNLISARDLTKPFVESTGPNQDTGGDIDVEGAAAEARAFKERIMQQSLLLEAGLKRKQKEISEGPEVVKAKTVVRRRTIEEPEEVVASPTNQTPGESSVGTVSGIAQEEVDKKLAEQAERLQLEWSFKLKELERKKDAVLKEATTTLTDVLRFCQENIEIPAVIGNPAFKFLTSRGVNLARVQPKHAKEAAANPNMRMVPVLPTDSTGVQSDEDEFPSILEMQTELALRGLNNAQKLGPAAIMLRRGLQCARDVLGKFVSNTAMFDDFSKIIKLELQNVMNPRMNSMLKLPKREDMVARDATVNTLLRTEDWAVAKANIMFPGVGRRGSVAPGSPALGTSSAVLSEPGSPASPGKASPGKKAPAPKGKKGKKEPKGPAVTGEELEKMTQQAVAQRNVELVAAMQAALELSKGCQFPDVEDEQNAARQQKQQELDALLQGFNTKASLNDHEDGDEVNDNARDVATQTQRLERTNFSQTEISVSAQGAVSEVAESDMRSLAATSSTSLNEDLSLTASSVGPRVTPPPAVHSDGAAKSLADARGKRKGKIEEPAGTAQPTPAKPSLSLPAKTAIDNLKKQIEQFTANSQAARKVSDDAAQSQTVASPQPAPFPATTKPQPQSPALPSKSVTPQVSQRVSPATGQEHATVAMTSAGTPEQEANSAPTSDHPTFTPPSMAINTQLSDASSSTATALSTPMNSLPPSAPAGQTGQAGPGSRQPQIGTPIRLASIPVTPSTADSIKLPMPSASRQAVSLSDGEFAEGDDSEEEGEEPPAIVGSRPGPPKAATPLHKATPQAVGKQTMVPEHDAVAVGHLKKRASVAAKSPLPANFTPSVGDQGGKLPTPQVRGIPPLQFDPDLSPAFVAESSEQRAVVDDAMAEYLRDQASSFAYTLPLSHLKPMYDGVEDDIDREIADESPLSDYTLEGSDATFSVDRSLRKSRRTVMSAPIGKVLLPVRRKVHQQQRIEELQREAQRVSPVGRQQLDSAYSHLTTPPRSAFPMSGVNSAEAALLEQARQLTAPITPRTEKLLLAGDWQKLPSGGEAGLSTSMMVDNSGNYLVQGKDGKYYRVPLGSPKNDAVHAANALASAAAVGAPPGSGAITEAMLAPQLPPTLNVLSPGSAGSTSAISPPSTAQSDYRFPEEYAEGAKQPPAATPAFPLPVSQRTSAENPASIVLTGTGFKGQPSTGSGGKGRPSPLVQPADPTPDQSPEADDLVIEGLPGALKIAPSKGKAPAQTRRKTLQQQPAMNPINQRFLPGGDRERGSQDLVQSLNAPSIVTAKADKSEASKRTKKLGADSKEQFQQLMREEDEEEDQLFGRRNRIDSATTTRTEQTEGVTPMDASLTHGSFPRKARKSKAKPQGLQQSDPFSQLWGGGFTMQRESSIGSELVQGEDGDFFLKQIPHMEAMSELVRQMRDRVEGLETESDTKTDAMLNLKDELTRLRRQLLDVMSGSSTTIITRTGGTANDAQTEKQLTAARTLLAEREVARNRVIKILGTHSPGDLERFLSSKTSTGLLEMTDFLEKKFLDLKADICTPESFAKSCALVIRKFFPDEVTPDFDRKMEENTLLPLETVYRRVGEEIQSARKRADEKALYGSGDQGSQDSPLDDMNRHGSTGSGGMTTLSLPDSTTSVMISVLQRLQHCNTYTLEAIDGMLAAREDSDGNIELPPGATITLPGTGMPDLAEDLFPIAAHLRLARKGKKVAVVNASCQTGSAPIVIFAEFEQQCDFTQRLTTPSFFAASNGPTFVTEGCQTEEQQIGSPRRVVIEREPASPRGSYLTSIPLEERPLMRDQGTQAVAFHAPKLRELGPASRSEAVQTSETLDRGQFWPKRPVRPQLARLYFMARQVKDSSDTLMNWLFAVKASMESKDKDDHWAVAQQLNALRKLGADAGESPLSQVVISMMEKGLETLNTLMGRPLEKFLDLKTVIDPTTILPAEVSCEEMNYQLKMLMSRVDRRMAEPPEDIESNQRALNRWRHKVIESMTDRLEPELRHSMSDVERETMNRLVAFESLTPSQQRRLFHLQTVAMSLVLFSFASKSSFIGLAKAVSATGPLPLQLGATSALHIRMAKSALCSKVLPPQFRDVGEVEDLATLPLDAKNFIADVLSFDVPEFQWLSNKLGSSLAASQSVRVTGSEVAGSSPAASLRRSFSPIVANSSTKKPQLDFDAVRFEHLNALYQKLEALRPCKVDVTFTTWFETLRTLLLKLLGPRIWDLPDCTRAETPKEELGVSLGDVTLGSTTATSTDLLSSMPQTPQPPEDSLPSVLNPWRTVPSPFQGDKEPEYLKNVKWLPAMPNALRKHPVPSGTGITTPPPRLSALEVQNQMSPSTVVSPVAISYGARPGPNPLTRSVGGGVGKPGQQNGGATSQRDGVLSNVLKLTTVANVRSLTPMESRSLSELRATCTQSAVADSVSTKTLRQWLELEIRASIAEQRESSGLESDTSAADAILDKVRAALFKADPHADPGSSAALLSLTPAQTRLFVQYLRGLPVRGGAALPSIHTFDFPQ